MPVTRADELEARPADNAKELLALADNIEQERAMVFVSGLDRAAFFAAWQAYRNTPIDLIEDSDDETCKCVANAIRAYLSARQQASVEDLGVWIYLNYGVGMEVCETIARALLAKYDIFEKVEG